MPKILCLTGWGQDYSSLQESLLPKFFSKFSTSSLNYFALKSFLEVESQCKLMENPDIIIGWSLGGQISLRLIESQIFKPKLLVLIAPPFQLVKDSKITAGMALNIYEQFYKNFSSTPDLTLKKFAILSLMNDKNKAQILKNIKIDEANYQNLALWLEELKKFSCFDLKFNNMPPATMFVGRGDMVVHPFQVKYFEDRIKNLEVNWFSNCGHAPHLSDKNLFNELLYKKICETNIV